jgi:hypothetical protein
MGTSMTIALTFFPRYESRPVNRLNAGSAGKIVCALKSARNRSSPICLLEY